MLDRLDEKLKDLTNFGNFLVDELFLVQNAVYVVVKANDIVFIFELLLDQPQKRVSNFRLAETF